MKFFNKPAKLILLVVSLVVGVSAVTWKDGDRMFEISKNIEIFVNVFKELNKNYVDEIDPAELMRIGIDAMVSSLDPFTNYISESQVERYRISDDERFQGIGASVVVLDEKAMVTDLMEGGAAVADRVSAIAKIGVPVMGHLGMTPQSVHQYGGYKVQGKGKDRAQQLLEDAQALEAAGAVGIVLEAIPAGLAKTVTEALTIPTIGIGAGPHCDGQVLVLYDLLGLFDEFVPKFVKPYAHLKVDALQALRRYKDEVEQGTFPSDSESYH